MQQRNIKWKKSHIGKGKRKNRGHRKGNGIWESKRRKFISLNFRCLPCTCPHWIIYLSSIVKGEVVIIPPMQPRVSFTRPIWEPSLGWDELHKNFTQNTGCLFTAENAWPVQGPAQSLIAHSNAKVNSKNSLVPSQEERCMRLQQQNHHWLRANLSSITLWKKKFRTDLLFLIISQMMKT